MKSGPMTGDYGQNTMIFLLIGKMFTKKTEIAQILQVCNRLQLAQIMKTDCQSGQQANRSDASQHSTKKVGAPNHRKLVQGPDQHLG